MKIEGLCFEGRPNHRPAVERVEQDVKESGVAAEVVELNVPDDAASRSLSVCVTGIDIEPSAHASKEFGMIVQHLFRGDPGQNVKGKRFCRVAMGGSASVLQVGAAALLQAGGSLMYV